MYKSKATDDEFTVIKSCEIIISPRASTNDSSAFGAAHFISNFLK